MRKLFAFLVIGLFAAGCEGPMGPMGPAGRDGETPTKVWNSNLSISQWSKGTDDIGPHFYADLKIPELDEAMINGDGLYQLMWRYSAGGFEIRQTLETTIYHTEDDGYLWSENISCQFSRGEARVIIRYSDFDMDRIPPYMEFIFAGMY